MNLDIVALFRQFRAPRYWPVWLGFALMWLAAKLPRRMRIAVGTGLGHAVGKLARSRRHIARVNLDVCFPEREPKARSRLLEAHLGAVGVGAMETALCWWAPDGVLRELVTITGMEHYDAALAQGRGVILLTGHFTTLELGAGLFALHRPFHAMYRAHANPLYDTVMRWARERRSQMATIRRDDLRGMLRALRQGEAVWYAPDQDYGAQGTVFVPFFGVPARTITATGRLARMSGSPVVPYYPVRLPDGRYRVTVLPALEYFPSGDDTADATRINALVESWIREAPEQYLWVHRRFKGRPPGAASVY